jgi:adenylosuccinate synthase
MEAPGWQQDISECTSYEALPANAQSYVAKIEEITGVPAKLVSVGKDRAQTILR